MAAQDWDRLETESEAAYRAFRKFLELGPDRTVLRAYREQHPGKEDIEQVSGRWNSWLETYRWRSRALAYDHHQAAVARRGAERALEKNAERWENERTAWLNASMERAKKLAAKCDTLLAFPVTDTTAEVGGKPAVISPIGTLELQRAARCAVMAHELAFACINEALPRPDVAWDPNSTEAEEVERLLAAAGLRIVPLGGDPPAAAAG